MGIKVARCGCKIVLGLIYELDDLHCLEEFGCFASKLGVFIRLTKIN
jgi:hypothetical protein